MGSLGFAFIMETVPVFLASPVIASVQTLARQCCDWLRTQHNRPEITLNEGSSRGRDE